LWNPLTAILSLTKPRHQEKRIMLATGFYMIEETLPHRSGGEDV
jgi:hypothetical protein